MVVLSDGSLESAVQDTCKNYKVIGFKPTWVRSSRLGQLYECANFSKIPEGVNGCLGCYNWQNFDGTYVHAKERERDLVS